MRCRCPWALKMVRFVENSLSFNQLNISRADISCLLENDVGEAKQSTQPVVLYITVNITPPYSSDPSIPIENDDSPAKEDTIPGRIQFPSPEHLLLLSHHQPVGTCTHTPQIWERMSPSEDFLFALDRANEAMQRIVPIGRSNTWERAVEKINWVMDTLSPIAEVRVMPFCCPRLG